MLRLRARFDASLPLRSVFSHPTPAAFARYLQRNVRQDAAVTPALVEEADHRADQPLSLAQRRMWFVSRLEPDSARYSVPITLRLTGVLDVAALEAAFTRVVARHSVLRSVYPQVKESPYSGSGHPARSGSTCSTSPPGRTPGSRVDSGWTPNWPAPSTSPKARCCGYGRPCSRRPRACC